MSKMEFEEWVKTAGFARWVTNGTTFANIKVGMAPERIWECNWLVGVALCELADKNGQDLCKDNTDKWEWLHVCLQTVI